MCVLRGYNAEANGKENGSELETGPANGGLYGLLTGASSELGE